MDPSKEEFSNPKEVVKAKRFFSADELDAMRREQTEKQIELDDIEAEIRDLKKKNALRVKEIKATNLGIRQEIKAGFTHEDRECYLTPDFTNGLMQYVDCQTSEVLMTRKLLHNEKQLRFEASKTA